MNRRILRAVAVAALATGGALALGAPAQADSTGPNAGIGTGNQVSNTVQAPVSVCGNAIAIGGFASASCTGGAWATNNPGNSAGDSNASSFSRTWSRKWNTTWSRTWS